jgi:aryl-alcohol dehydrogenase-like predicted oxidoreductase
MAEAQTAFSDERITLGSSNIQVSPLGIGTWQWGDRLLWNYGGGGYSDEDLRASFDHALQAGINFFDSAEVYGSGRSETLLGQAVRAAQSAAPPVIATKFAPYPWRLRRKALVSALKASLKRLGLPSVDLYQIHWPAPPMPVEHWAAGLADAVQAGLTRAVGVSNYSVEQMRRATETLARYGIPLASNQVRYHLLDRSVERSGLLKACREMNDTLIAYSPLGQGLLTGK